MARDNVSYSLLDHGLVGRVEQDTMLRIKLMSIGSGEETFNHNNDAGRQY